MSSITPCRDTISDRFPVASFAVRVPADRCFEVACATDPRLFHPDRLGSRTRQNFYTSRGEGLMRLPRGQGTYLLPPDQLRRFAGAQRLYYALGTYGGARGENPELSVVGDRLEQAPFVRLAPEFTGRNLERNRLGGVPDARWGGVERPGPLRWGGDAVLARRPAPAHRARRASDDYDDGFDPALWRGRAATAARGLETAAAAIELDGYEDAPDFARRTPHSPPRLDGNRNGNGTGEPDGYEDAPALTAASAQAQRYGARGHAVMRPVTRHARPAAAHQNGRRLPAPMPTQRFGNPARAAGRAPARPRTGRAADFSDDPLADPARGARSSVALQAPPAPLPLTIPEKLRIILPVTVFETGVGTAQLRDAEHRARAYGATNANTDGAGLSWGLIQFTQRGGALGQVLSACRGRAPQRFAEIFGDAHGELLAMTNAETPAARMVSIEGAPLWEEPWLGRFGRAGAVPEFQNAQNEVALRRYFDPNLPLARWLGFDSDRALAMLFDRTVQQGLGGGRTWVLDAVSPIRSDADRGAALQALGFADVRAFQGTVPGLEVDGAWGPLTHAALLNAHRDAGAASPLAVPERDEMLRAIADAAAAQNVFWAERPRRLLENTTDFTDATYELDLP